MEMFGWFVGGVEGGRRIAINISDTWLGRKVIILVGNQNYE